MTDPLDDRAQQPSDADGPAAQLKARAGVLREVLDAVHGRIDPEAAALIDRELEVVDERLAHAMDRSVVALIGGTGSGKSSLFNALSGLQFAEVSVRRPTTAEVMACIWGEPTPELLDWLDIPQDRRVQRVSALDGNDEADLAGLVLLDLPDHDSIAVTHRREVERLLPMADVLVWVLDPQKYADDAIHSRYLATLMGHEAAVLVVLNQADTLDDVDRELVLADLGRLLSSDGLEGVEPRAVSARQGTGVAELREELVSVVSARGSARTRVEAVLSSVAARMAGALAAGGEVVPGGGEVRPGAGAGVGGVAGALPRADAVAALERILDVDSLAAMAAARVRAGGSSAEVLGSVQLSLPRVAEVRDLVVGAAHRAVPERWRDLIDLAVPSDGELADGIRAALRRVGSSRELPDRPARGRRGEQSYAADVVGLIRVELNRFVDGELIAPAEAVLEEHRALLKRLADA